jgi:hypothetical protein
MIDEIKKSVNSILYERARSPLFGTFAISWLFWNWRIFYITLFMDKSAIPNKLDFIHRYLYNQAHLIWFPLVSTIILLTIVPFINNGAFWLDMKFRKWRIDQRHEIEKKQLLTVEQSLLLREQIKSQEERFQKITAEKEQEIKILEAELLEATKKPEEKVITVKAPKEKERTEADILFERIKNKKYVKEFLAIGKMINKDEYIDNDDASANYFLELGLLKSKGVSYNGRSRMYALTPEGEIVLKKARLLEQ